MYCKKCGTVMDDGAVFCGKCGAMASGEENVQNSQKQARGRVETIVLQVSKADESSTINRYRCFGWILINNQEVNVTSVYGGSNNGNGMVSSSTETYVKLTFERNTGMDNFDIIDGYYERYKALEAEKEQLLKPLNKLFLKWFLIIGVVATIIAILITKPWSYYDYFSGSAMVWAMLIGSVSISAGVGVLGGYIGSSIEKKVLLNKLAPKIKELNSSMDQLATEASRYL